MESFNAVIGVVGAGLALVGLLQANFPESTPEGPTVNIKAGLPTVGDDAASLSGQISHIYSYDVENVYSGEASGGHIDNAGVLSKVVDQSQRSTGGKVASYISVANDNDATCIAWITVSQYEQSQMGGAWTGDIGYHCGQAWYNSQEPAGQLKGSDGKYDGPNYVPKCTWLDGDHTGSIKNAALKFDVEAYGQHVSDTVNQDACAPTIFDPDNGLIGTKPAKRAIYQRDRPDSMKQTLVMSKHASQPAEELCSSTTSWGPDFVGPDGRFCDMESKTLSPLCSTSNVSGCIEIDGSTNTVSKRMVLGRRSINKVHKSYTTVHKWGGYDS